MLIFPVSIHVSNSVYNYKDIYQIEIMKESLSIISVSITGDH